ncbi:hypothetical protein UlMin_028034 [Ulmus minor]
MFFFFWNYVVCAINLTKNKINSIWEEEYLKTLYIHDKSKRKSSIFKNLICFFFLLNCSFLDARYIQQHNEVELSALGMAITTVVTIAEILKNNGLSTEKILTSTVGMKDENKGRLIEIVLGKSEKFDSLMTATAAAALEQANDEKADQQ